MSAYGYDLVLLAIELYLYVRIRLKSSYFIRKNDVLAKFSYKKASFSFSRLPLGHMYPSWECACNVDVSTVPQTFAFVTLFPHIRIITCSNFFLLVLSLLLEIYVERTVVMETIANELLRLKNSITFIPLSLNNIIMMIRNSQSAP